MKFEEHCEECRIKLGCPYENVHRWLDELQPKLGPDHRKMRHNAWGICFCIDKWGYGAGAAACLHIAADEGDFVKEGSVWAPR